MTTESSQVLEPWLKQHPDDAYARLALAETLINQGAIGEALSHYHQILALNPDNITALNNLAWHLRLDRPEQALACITQAASIAPESPEVLDTMGVLNQLGGDHRLALRNLDGHRQQNRKNRQSDTIWPWFMSHWAIVLPPEPLSKKLSLPRQKVSLKRKLLRDFYLGLTQD